MGVSCVSTFSVYLAGATLERVPRVPGTRKILRSINITHSKVEPLLSDGTRKSRFLTRPLQWVGGVGQMITVTTHIEGHYLLERH